MVASMSMAMRMTGPEVESLTRVVVPANAADIAWYLAAHG
jgi:hypothetical protein